MALCIAGPSTAGAERSVSINAPADKVKTQLLDLHFFQEKWSPWTEKDPNMKVTYSGETGKPGNSYAWQSEVKDVGNGSMEFIGINGDTTLQALRFEGMGESKVYFISTAEGSGTKVSWGMRSNVPFFGRGVMLFMNMDKMIGPDFEKGLNKLKTEIENMATEPVASNYEIKEIEWPAKTYYGTAKATMSFEKLGPFFAENFPKIGADFGKHKVEMEGAPSCVYFKWDDKNQQTECAAVMVAAKGGEIKGWEKYTMPPSKVLQIQYYGAYDKSYDAHMAMDKYMKEKNLTQTMVIEEYVTDPMTEKDTAKWLTNIFYVLK